MLELAVLGLLHDGELHGYELKRRVRDLPGGWEVSFGSLYPALGRLEASGAVKVVEARTASVPAIPLTGSLGGEVAAFLARRAARSEAPARTRNRNRKAYGLTEAGRARFVALVDDDATDERCFALKVAFARHLPPDRRSALVERRRRQLLDQQEDRRRQAARADGGRLADPYLRLLAERRAAALDEELAWLERLAAISDPTTEDIPRP